MSDEFYKMLSIVLAAIFGSIPSVFAYLSLRESQKNSKKIDVLHESVNGKITQLLEVSKVADTATGKEEGIAQEKAEQKEKENNK